MNWEDIICENQLLLLISYKKTNFYSFASELKKSVS